MSSVRVAIPLLRGKRRFHFEKGRRWSIAEHVVLAALAVRPQTAAELADAGRMPRRLVVEMLIRLMRAGWVELQAGPSQTTFSASASGIAAAARAELPVLARPMARWMNFVIDRITGTVFRPRELPFLHRNAVEERVGREPLVWLEPRNPVSDFQIEDLIEHLFVQEDESFTSVDPAGDRLMERYGLVLVRNSVIEGLPERAPEALRDAVLAAARTFAGAARGTSASLPIEAVPPRVLEPRPVSVGPDDLIVGGSANAAALHQLIDGARDRLIIHSTFVSERAVQALLPRLRDAAAQGARVDLLWGEGDDPRSSGRTRAAVARLREQFAADGTDELVRLHPVSTRSHAKFVIADRGGGAPIALLGSCNWLSSDMQLVEAAVRLREAGIVADLLFQAAELSRGRDGYWNELTSELARYAALVAATATEPRRDGGATARLVLAPDHKALVLRARADARTRMFIASHRISATARQAFLIPVRGAIDKNNIAVSLRYGLEPAPNEPSWAAITEGLDLTGVDVSPTLAPPLHAKLLGWDADNMVITSLNWLSADPSDNHPRREIGVHLHGAGLADALRDKLRAATEAATAGEAH